MTNWQTLSPEQIAKLDQKTRRRIKHEFLARAIEAAETHPGQFIDRLCYTFNPKVRDTSPHLPFRLFPFQFQLVEHLQFAIKNGHDLFIEKCREMGATYTTLDVLLWFWLYVPGSNFLIGSRVEHYVDSTGLSKDGETSNKEESLFGKLDYTLERLPREVLPAGFDPRKHRTYMSLRNPVNGNVIGGESSNPNFSRGGRQTAVLLDEFAFWENDTSAWGSTADTTNCRIILTTPGIRPNTKAKRLREGRDGEQIKIVTLTHDLDPRKDTRWLETQRARRSEEDFAREVLINWEASVKGIVYPEIRRAELGEYGYLPNEMLYQSWDFGLDGLATQWWQRNPVTHKWRLIAAYDTQDQPIQYMFPFCGKPIDSAFDYDNDAMRAIEEVRYFKRPIHFGDPDVAKRSMTSPTMTSVKRELAAIGVHVQTRPESNDFRTRREATKVFLQAGIEVNNTPGCLRWLDCMKQARYPQRTDTSQQTTEINLPIHDETSHHRTATEYLCVNKPGSVTINQPEDLPTNDIPRFARSGSSRALLAARPVRRFSGR